MQPDSSYLRGTGLPRNEPIPRRGRWVAVKIIVIMLKSYPFVKKNFLLVHEQFPFAAFGPALVQCYPAQNNDFHSGETRFLAVSYCHWRASVSFGPPSFRCIPLKIMYLSGSLGLTPDSGCQMTEVLGASGSSPPKRSDF